MGVDVLANALATIAAAFAGAWAAFRYGQHQQEALRREQQIEECNRAMLVLLRQYNWLLNYRRQFLEPLRKEEARHLLVPPSDVLDYRHWTVNVPALSFLLQTEASEIPFMLGLAEEKFHGVTALINARSVEHREFQRALADSALDTKARQPLDAVHGAIGERLAVTLQRATDQLFLLTDEAIAALEACGRDVRNVLRATFPGAKVIGFAPPPTEGQVH